MKIPPHLDIINKTNQLQLMKLVDTVIYLMTTQQNKALMASLPSY